MMINRFRFTNHHSIDNDIGETPTIPIPPISTGGYSLADFGENAINNHTNGHEYHSNKNQVIFNYVTKDFRDRCTSYESYKTTPYNGFVNDELAACKNLKADIVYTPYVDAARWTNTDNENFILVVGSHYDNDGQGDVQVGDDNNRHDITVNANTFLIDSIAVSARRDTPELFKNSTSEGFGMEFFEDCSPEALDIDYPNRDMPSAFAELLSVDGINLTSTVHLNFSSYLEVGEEITIRHSSNESTWQTTTISEIVSGNHVRVSTPITPIPNGGIYGWRNVSLGEYVGAQQESWAVPLVAGKLKVIKMTTNSDWETVRAAARATAKRNPTGIEEIDSVNWDIYRGFGCIDVQASIDYINNNA